MPTEGYIGRIIIVTKKAVCLMFAVLAVTAIAYVRVQPTFYEPTDTTNTRTKITGVDAKTDDNDRMYATGTYWDGSEYVIFYQKIEAEGTDTTKILNRNAWKMVPPLTEDVNPKVLTRGARSLVWFQKPSTKKIYTFDMKLDETDCSVGDFHVAEITLPVAYQDSFDISFTEKYTGFVGI